MTALPGDFDDGSGEELSQPVLPPDDRLWRHPSELDPLGLDPDAVRRRWLLSHPSRRSVLTAGIVGALLASGVVAIATHLADTLATPGHPSTHTTIDATVLPAATPTISASLDSSIARVASAMTTVEATRASVTTATIGVVVRSDGMLLVPESGVAGASSLLVTLANGDVYVGYLVGSDALSGLAVVRINGASGLATISFSRAPMSTRSFVLAVTSPGKRAYAVGTVRSLDPTVRVGGHKLVGAVTTNLPANAGAAGTPLLNSTGTVQGIVTGASHDVAVVAPSWLAAAVASDLMTSGTVVHGWLGARLQTTSGHPVGARIVSMMRTRPLERAGLRLGEVIVSVDRTPVATVAALKARLYALRPGTRVVLRVDDGGAMATRVVVLAASPGT